MARSQTFKQSDATRALKAAVAAGLKPTGYRIDPTGAINVLFGASTHDKLANSFDEIQGT